MHDHRATGPGCSCHKEDPKEKGVSSMMPKLSEARPDIQLSRMPSTLDWRPREVPAVDTHGQSWIPSWEMVIMTGWKELPSGNRITAQAASGRFSMSSFMFRILALVLKPVYINTVLVIWPKSNGTASSIKSLKMLFPKNSLPGCVQAVKVCGHWGCMKKNKRSGGGGDSKIYYAYT